MNVDDIIAERIAAARRRAEADKQRRQELAEARQHGLAARHAQRLRNQASARTTDGDDSPTLRRSVNDTTEEKHMKIATGNVHHVAPCPPGWLVVLNNGADQEQEIVCPLIGWATVVEAHLADGTTSTAVQPAFLYLNTVWTPGELREHDTEFSGYEIRSREISGRQVTRV
ncbi:hypothetical protein ACIQVF_09775 [Streptomyces tendae]|uniref:hypothetical protein n=1 Tax=Streptomyces tendae TaxID=1932 RepID=UPI0038169D95